MNSAHRLPKETILFFIFGWLIFSRIAVADDTAIELFDSGIAAFQRGEYQVALDDFEASYNAGKNPKVLFNIAMCQQAIYRYADAIDTLKRFVDESQLDDNAPILNDVRSAQEEMLKEVGKMTFTSSPSSAEVFLNGKSIGQTPIEMPTIVNPGKHNVTIELSGFKTYQKEILISKDTAMKHHAVLQEEQGTIEIRCALGMEVVLDEQTVVPCPYTGDLSAGHHEVVLKAPGVQPIHRGVVLRPNERLRLDLSPSASVSPNDFHFSEPKPAKVSPLRLALGSGAVVMSIGASVLGGYFAVKRQQTYDDGLLAIEERDRDRYDDIRQNRLPNLSLKTTISFTVGGALLATGIVLLVLSKRRKEAPNRVTLRMAEDHIAFHF